MLLDLNLKIHNRLKMFYEIQKYTYVIHFIQYETEENYD